MSIFFSIPIYWRIHRLIKKQLLMIDFCIANHQYGHWDDSLTC